MNHEHAQQKYIQYLLGELKGRQMKSFKEHLEQCEVCQRELGRLERLHGRLRDEMPEYRRRVLPDRRVLSRLVGRAVTEGALRPRRRPLVPVAIGVVAVVVLGLVVVFGTPLRDSLLGRGAATATPEPGALPTPFQLFEPFDGQVVTQSPVRVIGKAVEGSRVRVNEIEADVSEDGSFVAYVPLKPGTNRIEVYVTTPDGGLEMRGLSVAFIKQ